MAPAPPFRAPVLEVVIPAELLAFKDERNGGCCRDDEDDGSTISDCSISLTSSSSTDVTPPEARLFVRRGSVTNKETCGSCESSDQYWSWNSTEPQGTSDWLRASSRTHISRDSCQSFCSSDLPPSLPERRKGATSGGLDSSPHRPRRTVDQGIRKSPSAPQFLPPPGAPLIPPLKAANGMIVHPLKRRDSVGSFANKMAAATRLAPRMGEHQAYVRPGSQPQATSAAVARRPRSNSLCASPPSAKECLAMTSELKVSTPTTSTFHGRLQQATTSGMLRRSPSSRFGSGSRGMPHRSF